MPCVFGLIQISSINIGSRRMTLTRSIATQNVQISSGQLGGNPAVKGQLLNASIMAQSLLKTPDEFRKIVLRVEPGWVACFAGRHGTRGTG